MNALRTLASCALLGTERRVPDWPSLEGGIGEMVALLDGQPVEQRLLRTAGIVGTCHLAGWTPQAAAPNEAGLCGEETLAPLRHEPFEQALATALAEGPVRVQAGALAALTKARCALPPRLLPKALDVGKRSAALRPFLLPMLAQRGAWLAKQNPDWAYAIGAGSDVPDLEAWEQGGLEQRKLLLQTLRKQDAAKARGLVVAALATEGARERAALLEETSTALSLDDQDMLESALRDKSKEVRETAARLLGSLPGSRFMERMSGRLAACLSKEKKFLRGEVFKIEPPTQFVAEWTADLIEEAKPQTRNMGTRAWWLFQIVRHAPLVWWEEQTGMKPGELLSWAAKTEWKEVLLQGWAVAQSLQRRADWAAAFLDATIPEGVNINRFELLDALPPGEREKHLIVFLQEAVAANTAVSPVLDRCLRALPLGTELQSPDLARRIVGLLKDHLHGGRAQHDWPLRASLVELACVLPPSLFDDAQRGWDLARPEVQPFVEAIARFSSVLDARKVFHSFNP